MQLACAIIRDDPPSILLAESLDALHRVIAYKLIAQSKPDSLAVGVAERLQELLLEESWAEALQLWMAHTDVIVDVYPEHEMQVHTDAGTISQLSGLELQFTPLFSGAAGK